MRRSRGARTDKNRSQEERKNRDRMEKADGWRTRSPQERNPRSSMATRNRMVKVDGEGT